MLAIFNGKTQNESSGEAKSTDYIFCFPSPFLFSDFFCLLLAVFPSTGNLQPLSLDGGGIGFCLIPFMSPPLGWARRHASGTLCLQGC